MFLLVDNYDSFTYNLVHAFENQGVSPQVVRNDDESLLSLAGLPELEGVCISPGPSNPDNAGLCLQFLDRLPKMCRCWGYAWGTRFWDNSEEQMWWSITESCTANSRQCITTAAACFRALPAP